MTTQRPETRARALRRDARGFTLVELLVTVVVGAIILGATYAVMLSQQRYFARQTQVQDSRETLRAAAAILAAEVRQASDSGGDFAAIASDSFVLRTTLGFAVNCASVNPSDKFFYITSTWGQWQIGDSVLVFVDNNPGANDDQWRSRSITNVQAPDGSCAYGTTPELKVTLDSVGTGIRVGAQLRTFKWYVYKLYQESGRYWLGRRALDQVDYTGVVGPLTAPGANAGLVLTYYDANQVATVNTGEVASIEVTVRSESFGRAPGLAGSANAYIRDTLTTRAFLRNN